MTHQGVHCVSALEKTFHKFTIFLYLQFLESLHQIIDFFSTPCISMSTHCHWHNPILSTHLECWLIYEFDHNKQIINCVTRILSHVRSHFEAGLNLPHIFSGASSSSKMGCCRNNSLDLRHNPRTSASVIWTVFPGRLPRTGIIKTLVLCYFWFWAFSLIGNRLYEFKVQVLESMGNKTTVTIFVRRHFICTVFVEHFTFEEPLDDIINVDLPFRHGCCRKLKFYYNQGMCGAGCWGWWGRSVESSS